MKQTTRDLLPLFVDKTTKTNVGLKDVMQSMSSEDDMVKDDSILYYCIEGIGVHWYIIEGQYIIEYWNTWKLTP